MRDPHDAGPGLEPDARDDAFAARLATPLRAAEAADPRLGARVLATIRAGADPLPGPLTLVADRPAAAPTAAAPARRRRGWQGRVTVGIAPLGGLAAAACLAAAVLIGGPSGPAAAPQVAAVASSAARVDTVHLVRFVLVAPEARTVALVGEFNAWDRAAVPLTRTSGDGLWTVTVPLAEGRHEYAFVVDGERWTADPAAPARIADEFGVESSVLTVDGGAGAARRT